MTKKNYETKNDYALLALPHFAVCLLWNFIIF